MQRFKLIGHHSARGTSAHVWRLGTTRFIGVATLVVSALISATELPSAAATCFGHTPTIQGGPGDDVLAADPSSDGEVIDGGGGNDTIIGSAHADDICGGAGNDVIVDNAGIDDVDGGTGSDLVALSSDGFSDDFIGGTHIIGDVDTISFSGWNDALDLSVPDGSTSIGFSSNEWQGFEGIVGTPGSNTIVGSAGTEVIDGGGGADTIDGGGGNDILTGGTGDDTIEGGSGNDRITGSTGIDTIDGESGNDTISGNSGDDVLAGGSGADTIEGGSGIDAMNGGESDASLDVLWYPFSGGSTVDLASNTAFHGPGILEFEYPFGFESATGSSGPDRFFGESTANVLNGGSGDDLLVGRDGNDTLNAGTGVNVVRPGLGNDTATATPATGVAQTVDYSDFGFAMTINNTTSSSTGSGNDQFFGFDTFIGTAVADSFHGGSSNETFYGGGGNDLMDGNGGSDTVSYSTNVGAVDANLATGVATGANSGTDTLIEIENLVGTNSADVLTGNGQINVIAGRSGNDTIRGGASADTLMGEHGNDTLVGQTEADKMFGGAGNDNINGGAGLDVAFYDSAPGSVTADLTAGAASGADGTDVLYLIDSLVGSAFNDHLIGNNGANSLDGLAGTDICVGNGGADTLINCP